VLEFANAPDSGFLSPGEHKDASIKPPLRSLADFGTFDMALAVFMQERGVTFLSVPDELRKCVTWNDLATQIALNQQ
jgi:hypothetical protein